MIAAGQHEARHPVPAHPRELDADNRQERREEQREHRRGHHPVEHARHEGVALDVFRQIPVGGLERVGFRGAPLAVRRENHVARVGDEKHHAGEQMTPRADSTRRAWGLLPQGFRPHVRKFISPLRKGEFAHRVIRYPAIHGS